MLAKHSLVTYLVTEPASFVTVEFIDGMNGRTHITENIEKISDCFACVS